MLFALIVFASLMVVAGVGMWTVEKVGLTDRVVAWVEKL